MIVAQLKKDVRPFFPSIDDQYLAVVEQKAIGVTAVNTQGRAFDIRYEDIEMYNWSAQEWNKYNPDGPIV